jgi:hypothetical protein
VLEVSRMRQLEAERVLGEREDRGASVLAERGDRERVIGPHVDVA